MRYKAEDRMTHLPFNTDIVLENLPDGCQVFDQDWHYVYLNQRAEQILGRSREELIGKVCWEEYPEAVGTPFHAKYLEAMTTERTVIFEEFCPHESNWVEFTLYRYPDGVTALTKDITERKRAEETVIRSEQRYHTLFDRVLDAVMIADNAGKYVDVNPAACEIFGLPREQLLGKSVFDFAVPDASLQIQHTWEDFLRIGEQSGEFILCRPDGTLRTLEYRAKAGTFPGLNLSVLRDITERKKAEEHATRLVHELQEEREIVETAGRIGRLLSAELDLEKLVQAATDAATELTDAQFGAFFYNLTNPQGESYILYTISGVPREAFSRFPMPRNTPIFAPTFNGEAITRLGDVTKDPRYGQMSPHHGMPPGHLPVRSYLSIPVISRSGEVLGGLFFGHPEPDIFTERAERNLVGVVAQLTIALDNAKLYRQAQHEITERRNAEEALRESQAQTRSFLRDVLASVTEGRLLLCNKAEDLPQAFPGLTEPIQLTIDTIREARQKTMEAAQQLRLDKDRGNDLLTAVGEATMNAITHGGGGIIRVTGDLAIGTVQVWIEDHGSGIEMSTLPRATLERGFTTAGTFGHGFWLILKSVDRVWLLTGPTGTTVVLEQERKAPQPSWMVIDPPQQS